MYLSIQVTGYPDSTPYTLRDARLNTSKRERPLLLPALAAVLGAVLAATGLLESDAGTWPDGAIATVNSSVIAEREYRDYLDALQRDRRSPLSESDRRHVLDRLIDERLLIQRALDTGVATSDAAVRKAMVDAMVENLLNEVSAAPPTDTALREFFAREQAYFASPPLLHISRMMFRGENAQVRAEQARARLQQEPFDVVSAALADMEIVALPATPIPANRLQVYLGPTQTEVAMKLQTGEISPVLEDGKTRVILLCAQRVDSEAPPLEAIREQVVTEYQRRAAEVRLREYLDNLRDDAEVRIAEERLGDR